MNLFRTLLLAAALVASLAGGGAVLAENNPTGGANRPELRVGTFDSRAVTVAFISSEMFERELTRLIEEQKRAKAAGDDQKVKKLEAQGRAGQRRVHRQGFGTAPVDNILGRIKDKLPGIAKKASVDLIVSKWAVTYSIPGARFVDVTDLIIEPFEPDEKTKRMIRDLRGKPPVPLEEIE